MLVIFVQLLWFLFVVSVLVYSCSPSGRRELCLHSVAAQISPGLTLSLALISMN